MPGSTLSPSTKRRRCSAILLDCGCPDPDHSEGEQRYLLLGNSTHQRLLVVAFAERPTPDAAHLGQAGDPPRAEAI